MGKQGGIFSKPACLFRFARLLGIQSRGSASGVTTIFLSGKPKKSKTLTGQLAQLVGLKIYLGETYSKKYLRRVQSYVFHSFGRVNCNVLDKHLCTSILLNYFFQSVGLI